MPAPTSRVRQLLGVLAAVTTAACGQRADVPASGADSVLAAASVLSPSPAVLPASLAALMGEVIVRAETSLAGYTIRCYSVNPDYPLGLVVFDGERVVWTAGKRGDPSKEMDVDDVARCPFGPDFQPRPSQPPFGTDLNRDGAPDVVVTFSSAVGCDSCVGLNVLSLARPFRTDGIAFTDSFGFSTVAGDTVLITVTDVSIMNDLEGTDVRPVAVFAWRGGRWTLATDRMRTPQPDSAALDAEAARLRSDHDRLYLALPHAMATLVAGGHEAEAWGLMRRVLPDSEQTAFQRNFRGAVLESSLRNLLQP